MRRHEWPLRVHLAAFGLILLLPAIAIGAVGVRYYGDTERERLAETARELAADASRQIDRDFENLTVVLNTLASSPFLDSSAFRDFQARAILAVAGTDTHIILVRPDMQQLLNTRVPYGTPLPQTADREFVSLAFKTGHPQISNVFAGFVSGELVFNIDVPVIRNGAVRFVLIGSQSAKNLVSSLKRPETDLGWILTVSDRNDVVVSRSEEADKYVGEKMWAPAVDLSPGRSGVHRLTGRQNDEVLRAYRRSYLSGWMTSAFIPANVIEAPLRRTWGIFTVAVCGLVGLLIAFAVLMGRRIALPIERLRASARSLGRGEPVPEQVSHLREANEVSHELARAAEELKRRQERSLFLMRELAHRTKNTLALTLAIARQSMARSDSYSDFQASFVQRLSGLGSSLDLLVRSEWRGTDLGDLVTTQLAPFVGEGSGRAATEGPPVWLNPDAAQQLGLAFHELATNATKYGALSVPGGRVEIAWQVAAEPAGRLSITWREAGGPPVAPPTEEGFGRTVIERAVAATLGAAVDVRFAPEGLCWRIDLPAESYAPEA